MPSVVQVHKLLLIKLGTNYKIYNIHTTSTSTPAHPYSYIPRSHDNHLHKNLTECLSEYVINYKPIGTHTHTHMQAGEERKKNHQQHDSGSRRHTICVSGPPQLYSRSSLSKHNGRRPFKSLHAQQNTARRTDSDSAMLKKKGGWGKRLPGGRERKGKGKKKKGRVVNE